LLTGRGILAVENPSPAKQAETLLHGDAPNHKASQATALARSRRVSAESRRVLAGSWPPTRFH
jgi:hypothetical protein